MPRPRKREPARAVKPGAPRRVSGGRPARFVALLRGVNVGRARRVAMADLRVLMTTLGYSDVVTLLNSGNVVFTAPASAGKDAAARIEQALKKTLGVETRVVVLAGGDLEHALASNPFLTVATDPARHLIAAIHPAADRARLEQLAAKSWAPEVVAVGRHVVYLWCPEGILESRLLAAVNRDLGEHVTSRNWTTMTKLGELAKAR